MKWFILIIVLFSSIPLSAQNEPRIIWITIDGLRWQELYTGADSLFIRNPQFTGNQDELLQKFWKSEAESRRKALFPFLWEKALKKGVFLGNRNEGNNFSLTNKVILSYPGYNEILTGFADDENIINNDKSNNPNRTILEALNENENFAYKDKIAVFGSWDVFPYIFNEDRSRLKVNAGYRSSLREEPSEAELLLDKIQNEFPRRWSTVRFDTFTHNYALESLKNDKPLVTFIAYGETDDFAHEGRYDKYLESAHRTDKMIEELWAFVQSDPFYKDNTTFIITTDHGRGEKETESDTWKHHGKTIANSDQTWFIAFGRGIKILGEDVSQKNNYTNQIAKTIASLLGFEYEPKSEAGAPLLYILAN
ncbi:MAG TPA: alkaline phosphatase family protein [Gillisia sp.]|nr:alkaline phosphatase family protein [Gillisia sp.]